MTSQEPRQLALPGMGAQPKSASPEPRPHAKPPPHIGKRTTEIGRSKPPRSRVRPAPPLPPRTLPRHETTLDGHTVSYVLKRSPTARYLRIEIGVEKGLMVVVPQRCSLDLVHRFLQRKTGWVLQKLAKFGQAEMSPAGTMLRSGDTIPFLGHTIQVVAKESISRPTSVDLRGNRLMACVRPGAARLRLAVENWYHLEGAKLIRDKVTTLAPRMEVKCRQITLRAQKTRWGSCSKIGNLNFNWRLLMAPEPVIDYVVIHELAHLKEMNHSKKFWAVVEAHCPRWHEHRKWLKDHQAELMSRLPG